MSQSSGSSGGGGGGGAGGGGSADDGSGSGGATAAGGGGDVGPTFWLDAVCFDQSNISDSLKVLPVNIMHCDKVLVLCGETYARRLWCVWELYTVFAFKPSAEAVRDVALEVLVSSSSSGGGSSSSGGGGGSGAPAAAAETGVAVSPPPEQLQRLAKFSLADAHCYDPNEESKLRATIENGGASVFEGHIRELAASVLGRRFSGRVGGGGAGGFHLVAMLQRAVRRMRPAARQAARRRSIATSTSAVDRGPGRPAATAVPRRAHSAPPDTPVLAAAVEAQLEAAVAVAIAPQQTEAEV